MKKLFLIQGTYFQRSMAFGAAFDPDNPDVGLRSTIEPVIVNSMFCGVIVPAPSVNGIDDEVGGGALQDRIGFSDLKDVVLTDAALTFTKKYDKRSDEIHYAFEKKGSEWIGTFHGSDTGRGVAKCVLVETTADFLANPNLELLESRELPGMSFGPDATFSVETDPAPDERRAHYKVANVTKMTPAIARVSVECTGGRGGTAGARYVKQVPMNATLDELKRLFE